MTDFGMRRTVMVDTQIRPSDVTKYPIIEALLTVPRELFVPDDKREVAYMGEHIGLGGNRVVIDPRTLAKMLDALDIHNDELILDIGSGLGYSAAVIARMAEAVVVLEGDPSLAKQAQANLVEAGVDNVVLQEGPLTEGAARHGPYDVITLQGAVAHLPQALTDQLKDGGRMAVLFDGKGGLGQMRIGYKIDGRMNWRYAFDAGAPVLPGFEKRPEFRL